jgi:hypothetical protein
VVVRHREFRVENCGADCFIEQTVEVSTLLTSVYVWRHFLCYVRYVALKNNADSGIFFSENKTKIQPNYLLHVGKSVGRIWHKTPMDFFFSD